MVKQTEIKPIIFDELGHFKNSDNWVVVDTDWCGLDYDVGHDGETSQDYEFQVMYDVNDDTITIDLSLHHDWEELYEPYSVPLRDINREDFEIEVISMYSQKQGGDISLDGMSYLFRNLEPRIIKIIQGGGEI